MKTMRKIWWGCLLLFCLFLSGCINSAEEGTTGVETTTQNTEEATTEDGEDTSDEIDEVTLDGLSRDILSNMTLEEKVGQMFFFGMDTLRTDGKTGKTKKVTKTTENMMNVLKPGGIILYSKNMKNQDQTKTLIEDLQENSKIPLFIGTEEAGGAQSRIASVSGMKIEATSSSAALGASGDVDLVYQEAAQIASYMKELGFNVNFAPSANLAQEENSQIIKENSYGSDVEKVSEMVTAFVSGLQGLQVSSVLSPFPGLGAGIGDTRKESVDITKTINELRKSEFLPFAAGIEEGIDFITVGHASYSAIMGKQTPASLSKLMITEILRKELEYESVIITDSMNERAITDNYSVEDAAVKAVKAGADMLLYPEESGKKAYQTVLGAVKTGEIEESRIEEAVLRILKVKIKRGLIPLDTDLKNSEK